MKVITVTTIAPVAFTLGTSGGVSAGELQDVRERRLQADRETDLEAAQWYLEEALARWRWAYPKEEPAAFDELLHWRGEVDRLTPPEAVEDPLKATSVAEEAPRRALR